MGGRQGLSQCQLVWFDGEPYLKLGRTCELATLLDGLQLSPWKPSHPPLHLDHVSRTLSVGATKVRLTHTEFRIVSQLAQQPGQYFNYQMLTHQALGWPAGVSQEATIRSHLHNIRGRLRRAGIPGEILQTRRGTGVRLQMSGVYLGAAGYDE